MKTTKLYFLIILVISFCSCKKETNEILIANFDGTTSSTSYKAQAYKYEDFKENKAIRHEYQIIGNGSGVLKISFIDSTFIQDEFEFPVLAAVLIKNNGDSSKNYTGYAGKLLIIKQSSDYIKGEFTLKLRNDNNVEDTLNVDYGKFELSLNNARRDF